MTTTLITRSKVAGALTAIALTRLPAAPAIANNNWRPAKHANRNWYPAKHVHVDRHMAKAIAHIASRGV